MGEREHSLAWNYNKPLKTNDLECLTVRHLNFRHISSFARKELVFNRLKHVQSCKEDPTSPQK